MLGPSPTNAASYLHLLFTCACLHELLRNPAETLDFEKLLKKLETLAKSRGFLNMPTGLVGWLVGSSFYGRKRLRAQDAKTYRTGKCPAYAVMAKRDGGLRAATA